VPTHFLVDLAAQTELLTQADHYRIRDWMRVRNLVIHSQDMITKTKAAEIVQGVLEICESLWDMAELRPANIQMQKTGSWGLLLSSQPFPLLIWGVRPPCPLLVSHPLGRASYASSNLHNRAFAVTFVF
jgi:hypothetical protein